MKLGLILIAGLVLFAFDNMMLDLADINCKMIRPAPIGYPVRICAITFDDKGIIGKLLK